MKLKRIKITALLLTAMVIISSCFASCSGNKSDSIDLSDINEMIIGSEMPEIIYADDNDIMLEGSFGIIKYNFKASSITERIPFEKLEAVKGAMLDFPISKDGKKIFIRDLEADKYFEYNRSSGKIVPLEKMKTELYDRQKPLTDFFEDYIKTLGENYVYGTTAVSNNNCILYLRANTNGLMKTLQIVKYDIINQTESEVMDIFK